MQCNHVMPHALRYVIAVWIIILSLPATAQITETDNNQYCNEQYLYCVNLPNLSKIEPHDGDAPNHGITITLSLPGNIAWTYAHWDAALLQSSRKVLLDRLKMINNEHSGAEVRVRATMLSGLPAYRIRINYMDTRPITEELVIAYRKPKNKSAGPGVVYEIGMKGTQGSYSANVATLNAFINTFRPVAQVSVGDGR
jgi:hypothetical protein